MLTQLTEELSDEIRIVYRHFPLVSIHDKALLSVQASEAAGIQGKFWEAHDYLFENQTKWNQLTVEDYESWLENSLAPDLDLAIDQFMSDLQSEGLATLAQDAWTEGKSLSIPGTPFILLNGAPYNGPLDPANMRLILKLMELKDLQYSECPPMLIDPLKQFTATIRTEKGDIKVDLFPDVAPLAVNSFVFLARNGWFDGITFHRVMPGFVAQAGDPTGTGIGGPGYAFKNETSPDLIFDRGGLLAMANSGPDTNGSQFFITFGPVADLNGGYTIFGEVVDGMDVVKSLTPRDPMESADLSPGDKIITIIIDEK